MDNWNKRKFSGWFFVYRCLLGRSCIWSSAVARGCAWRRCSLV